MMVDWRKMRVEMKKLMDGRSKIMEEKKEINGQLKKIMDGGVIDLEKWRINHANGNFMKATMDFRELR